MSSKGKIAKAIPITEIQKIVIGSNEILVFVFPKEDDYRIARYRNIIQNAIPSFADRFLCVTDRVKLAVISMEEAKELDSGATLS